MCGNENIGPMKMKMASEAVAGSLNLNMHKLESCEAKVKIPLDRKASLVYYYVPSLREWGIDALNPDLVTYTAAARPKFTDKKIYAGAEYVNGKFIAELTSMVNDRIEESGGNVKETKGIPSLRLRIGADLASWLKTRLSVTTPTTTTPEEQSINLYGKITRYGGTMYNLDFKKSREEGEWIKAINERTIIEVTSEFFSGSMSGGAGMGYSGDTNSITVKGMSEVKRLDALFYPKIYLMYNPSPDFKLNLEWKGLMSKVEEGAEKGYGGVITLERKGLRVELAKEMFKNNDTTKLSIGYTWK